MDKLDEYNLGQIQLVYSEHKSILFLIRIIKEAKVDKGKDKAYIEELEEKIKFLESKNKVKLRAKLKQSDLDKYLTEREINNIALVEVRKEELYTELRRQCYSLQKALKEGGQSKRFKEKNNSNFSLFQALKKRELEIDTLIKYIKDDN